MGLFGSRKKSESNLDFRVFEEAQQQVGENVQLVLRKKRPVPYPHIPKFRTHTRR